MQACVCDFFKTTLPDETHVKQKKSAVNFVSFSFEFAQNHSH